MTHSTANSEMIQDVDDQSDHDTWSRQPSLDDLMRHDIWTFRREFLERLWPSVLGWRVLEVGSGPAHDSLTFAQRGADVTALDRSKTGLDLAKRFYRDLGYPIRTVHADAGDLPFEDGQFDLAFNAGVLEHFTDDDLQTVIDEMIRVVKPGGHVLAFCPNRHNVFYQKHLKKVHQHRYEFERAFTAKELSQRFEARGLEDIRVSGVHVHPAPNYLLPTWVPKYHKIEPFFRSCFAWLERMHGLHRIKSLIGQDMVIWGTAPRQIEYRESITEFNGGPAVRLPLRRAA